jgi:hypothetical protein
VSVGRSLVNPLRKIETQLKITTHAHPASPTKNVTTNMRIAQTANWYPNDNPWSQIANIGRPNFLDDLF